MVDLGDRLPQSLCILVRLLFRDRLLGEINLSNMRLRDDLMISLKALRAMRWIVPVTTPTRKKATKNIIMKVVGGRGDGDHNEVIQAHLSKRFKDNESLTPGFLTLHQIFSILVVKISRLLGSKYTLSIRLNGSQRDTMSRSCGPSPFGMRVSYRL